MKNLTGFLIILVISSSTSALHTRSRIKNAHDDLAQLFSTSEESDSSKSKDENSESKETMICDTHHCRQLAHVFSESMDKSVDPCVDFYEFTCGGWEAKKPIPKYESEWNRIMLFQSTIFNHLREELEKEPSPKDILPIRQAKKWYRSCMDTKTRNTRGINPIASILMQTGGWPMVVDAEEWYERKSWQEIEKHYMRLSGDYTFYDIRPSARAELYIYTPDLPLDDVLPLKYRNYTGDDVETYRKLIDRVARLFIEQNKADVSDEQLQMDIDELIEFEKKLYLAIEEEESNDTRIINMDEIEDIDTPEDLDSLISWWENVRNSVKYDSDSESKRNEKNEIDWRNIINSFFEFADVKYNESTQISIPTSHYYLRLPKIFQSTSIRTIVNYIHWKFVSHALSFTIDEMKDILFDLIEHEYGIQERPPRWRECIKEMEMEDAVAFSFVEKYFKEATAEAAEEMTQNIKKELARQIDNSTWMTPEAKEAAKTKLNAMKALLGFPEWYKNRTAVINHYKGLNIGYDYLDNVLSFSRYQKIAAARKFDGQMTTEDNDWILDPTTVNAMYSPYQNTIVVPAAAFQIPLFGIQVPNYVNYGITGSVIAHELSHGFDVMGIRFDGHSMTDLWENDMMKMYYQQSRCFIKQFDNYYGGETVPPKVARRFEDPEFEFYETPEEFDFDNLTITMGKFTAGENIADTTGVQTVFNAYMKRRKNEAPNGEMKLPGFEDFSDEQMFFLSFAGAWCSVKTPEYGERKNSKLDRHSPLKLRTIGAVSNSLAFAEAFNCPKESPMNPKDKCSIWKEPGAAMELKPSIRRKYRRRRRFEVDW